MTPNKDIADIARQAWDLKLEQPYLRMRMNLPVEQLNPNSLEDARRRASVNGDLHTRLKAIDPDRLSMPDRVTHGFLVHATRHGMHAVDDWCELFPITPYTFGEVSNNSLQAFQSIAFDQKSDSERFLSLIRDYSELLRAQSRRLAAQAESDWRIPAPALPTIRATLQQLRDQTAATLKDCAKRGVDSGTSNPGFTDTVARLVTDEVSVAFNELIEAIGTNYESAAPTTVGMGQYPGGDAAYLRAIETHLTVRIDPEALHRIGLDEVSRITGELAALRSRMGGARDEAEFHAQLRSNPRCFAASPEALEATYQRHLSRMEERLPKYFRRVPKAPYGVARLAPSLEAGMSFGYYQPPPVPGAKGIYYYNGSGLETRLQINAAPLILHELAPGHHFHVALQAENESLPAIRREFFDNVGFVEGWAEYASSLGHEMGLYDDDYDRYGRLLHERFVAQRIVVDTGLNALGWSLDKARAYMRAQTIESDALIASETLRYATDMPGQALGYQYGQLKFSELRNRARELAGDRFDVRDFHDAILDQGCLPFPVLEEHLVRTFSH